MKLKKKKNSCDYSSRETPIVSAIIERIIADGLSSTSSTTHNKHAILYTSKQKLIFANINKHGVFPIPQREKYRSNDPTFDPT